MIKNFRRGSKWAVGYANMMYRWNAKKRTLTMEQHTALAIIASYRHDLHAACGYYASLPEEQKSKLRKFFDELMPIMLRSAGLPAFRLNIKEMEESVGAGRTSDVCAMMEAQLNVANEKIEIYLDHIDRTYNTSYKPTGKMRQRGLVNMAAAIA